MSRTFWRIALKHITHGGNARGGGGGGGGTSIICMHIGYVSQERTPFSALNFRSGAYHFHKFPKNPFRSITILHFWADFAVPETIIFKISLISTRSSPPTAGSAQTQRRGLARRVLAVPESPIFTLKTDQARSGAPHFQPQNGSSSFRSPPLSCSTGSSFRSPCQFFTLPRHIPTKIGGEYPPPPPPRGKWNWERTVTNPSMEFDSTGVAGRGSEQLPTQPTSHGVS